MKTTIELSDALLHSAKELARNNGTSLRALMERGLRLVLEQTAAKEPFKLKDASVAGTGAVQSDAKQWQQLEEEHLIARVKAAPGEQAP